MDYLEEIAETNDEIDGFDSQRYFEATADVENKQALKQDIVSGDLPLRKVYRQSDVDEIDYRYPADAEAAEVSGVYRKTDEKIESDILYSSDSDAFLRKYDDANSDPSETFRKLGNNDKGNYDGDTYNSRGDYLEEEIAPDVLEEQYDYNIICKGSQCAGGGSDGLDILAWDEDANELVVIDSKWKSGNKRTGSGILDNGRQVDGEKRCIQMSQCWVEDSVGRIPQSVFEAVDDSVARQIHNKHGVGDFDPDKKSTQLENAVDDSVRFTVGDGKPNADSTSYRRELFVARPHKNGKAVSDSSLRGRKAIKDQYTDSDLSEFVDGVKQVRFDNTVTGGT